MLSDNVSDIRLYIMLIASVGLPILTAVFGWVIAMERRLTRLEAKIDAICGKITGLFKKIEKPGQ